MDLSKTAQFIIQDFLHKRAISDPTVTDNEAEISSGIAVLTSLGLDQLVERGHFNVGVDTLLEIILKWVCSVNMIMVADNSSKPTPAHASLMLEDTDEGEAQLGKGKQPSENGMAPPKRNLTFMPKGALKPLGKQYAGFVRSSRDDENLVNRPRPKRLINGDPTDDPKVKPLGELQPRPPAYDPESGSLLLGLMGMGDFNYDTDAGQQQQPQQQQPPEKLEKDRKLHEAFQIPNEVKLRPKSGRRASQPLPTAFAAQSDSKLKHPHFSAKDAEPRRKITESSPASFRESKPLPSVKPNAVNFFVEATPIDLKTATALKELVFGNENSYFNEEWSHALRFNKSPLLRHVLLQQKRCPSGLLTCLQAHIMQEYLFSISQESAKPIRERLSDDKQRVLLATSLASILWKTGEGKRACFVLPTTNTQFQLTDKFVPDLFTETLILYKFNDREKLRLFILEQVAYLETPGAPACSIVLYSAVLSRKIESAVADMEEVSRTLLTKEQRCSFELVNLILHGKAVSHFFNDSSYIHGRMIRGVTGRNDVGLLSLKEHYKRGDVGTYYKTPRYPIWLIILDNHFSIIFCRNTELLRDWKAEKYFELAYYDPLNYPDEQIRLSIETENKWSKRTTDDESAHPIDLVIRTKWPGAAIDWNGFDPFLS